MSRIYATPKEANRRALRMQRIVRRMFKFVLDAHPTEIPEWLFTDCQEAAK